MDNFQISSYLSEVFDAISDTNKYFSNQKPWELKSVDEERMNTVLWVTCEMLRRFGILLQPVIPSGSSMLLGLLSISEKERTIDFLNDDYSLTPGDPIQNPEVIFPKIELKE
jgi:methionyl-tRNA synthetase